MAQLDLCVVIITTLWRPSTGSTSLIVEVSELNDVSKENRSGKKQLGCYEGQAEVKCVAR